MEFIPTLPTYASDVTAQTVWGWIRNRIENEEGVCFYKYPNVGGPNSPLPDLTVVARGYQPLVVRCLGIRGEQILDVAENTWTIRTGDTETIIDSPLLELGDIVVSLQEKFDRERALRRLFKVTSTLALPLVERTAFERRFGALEPVLWDEYGTSQYIQTQSQPPTSEQWRLTQSVI